MCPRVRWARQAAAGALPGPEPGRLTSAWEEALLPSSHPLLVFQPRGPDQPTSATKHS